MTLLSRVAAQEIGIELALPTAPEIVLNTTHSLVIIDQQAHRLSLRNLTVYFKNQQKTSYLYAKSWPQIAAVSSVNSANNRRWILIQLLQLSESPVIHHPRKLLRLSSENLRQNFILKM